MRMTGPCVRGGLAGLAMTAGIAFGDGLTLTVAPEGQDWWSGQVAVPNAGRTDGPLATLRGARDALRRLRYAGKLPPGRVTVCLRPGRYAQLEPLELEAEDSGTEGAPIRFVAAASGVTVTGGVRLWPSSPVTDTQTLRRLPEGARNRVRMCSLVRQGISAYGVEPTGMKARYSGMRLTCGALPMRLARWPNEGFTRIDGIPDGTKGHTFTVADERVAAWASESDPRGMGFWGNDWAADAIAFERIGPTARRITERVPGSVYGFRIGGRWFGYNLLCELDAPGEYWIDRLRGTVLFWPPEGKEKEVFEVSVGKDLVRMKDVSHVGFEGITFENCRGNAFFLHGGTNVGMVRCTMRNIGALAVEMHSGARHRVAGCELSHLGYGGISASGGDALALRPGGIEIDNNHVYAYAMSCLTYGPAIQLSGCGNRVTHNLIHEGPHAAILFGGREHRITDNEIHSVCLVSGEMGAIYAGRDWTLVGNVIERNYIHDLYRPCPQPNRGIMLDDGAGGITIRDNLFVRCAEGVCLSAIGNVVSNNVFVDCFPAIGAWRNWSAPDEFDLKIRNNDTRLDRLAKVPVDAPLWKERYPWLAMLRDSIRNKTVRPVETRTRIVGNIVAKGGEEAIHFHREKLPDAWVIENNLTGADPLFLNPDQDDYRLRENSPALALGVCPLKKEGVGLYAGPERAVWPVAHAVNTGCGSLVYRKPER